MIILKQRPEAWISILALCKIGAVCIPATYQLTEKDIVYRCNLASVRMIISVDDEQLVGFVAQSRSECPTLRAVAVVATMCPTVCMICAPKSKKRRTGSNASPTSLPIPCLYISPPERPVCPKMILHDYTYPAGHIITAKYWQHCEDGKLHLTMSDSGWAKFAWGKIYGQWICGSVIVAYDNEKFNAHNTLELIQEIGLTTFCAPPTVFRFLIKEDIAKYDFSSIKHCCIAGEALNPEVFNRFRELTGLTLTEAFGQTETPAILGNFDGFPIKPGSTGKPSPDFDVDIVDENGNSCEDGVVGSIVIRNLSKHYPYGLSRAISRMTPPMQRHSATTFTTRAIPHGAIRRDITGSRAARTTL